MAVALNKVSDFSHQTKFLEPYLPTLSLDLVRTKRHACIIRKHCWQAVSPIVSITVCHVHSCIMLKQQKISTQF